MESFFICPIEGLEDSIFQFGFASKKLSPLAFNGADQKRLNFRQPRDIESSRPGRRDPAHYYCLLLGGGARRISKNHLAHMPLSSLKPGGKLPSRTKTKTKSKSQTKTKLENQRADGYYF